jgi:hypothetical protein
MDLAHHPDPASREAVDQVDLPQRPRPVERPGVDAGDLLGQLRVGPGRSQGNLAHVELEVEVGIVDPVAVVEVEGNRGEAPAEGRHQWEAFGDELLEARQGQLAAGRGRRIEDRQRPDVPVVARVLERQELLIERGELAHQLL